MPDTPTVGGDDDFDVETTDHPFSFEADPDEPVYRHLLAAIERMGAAGPEAEERYQEALDRLFRHSEKVVEVIADEYRQLPEDRYLDRWSLIQLLVELAEPASLEFIDDVLSSEIPPERAQDAHTFSTVGEEVMIRTTAVEALTQIAADGHDEALELLRRHAHHDDFSVKRACVQGYLAHGGQDARQELEEELPKRDHELLDIERVDVREVPQAEGHEFLKAQTSDVPPPQPPAEEDEDRPQQGFDIRRHRDEILDRTRKRQFDTSFRDREFEASKKEEQGDVEDEEGDEE